jgi:predicted NBD/HSP70 family sugar kinase
MTLAKPSMTLLRSLTDEHVLRALLHERRLTRAELAGRTGISKPTVSDSVRRLAERGLVRDTGERTAGRGGVGSYYSLADDLGVALVVSIAADGMVAETIDPHGDVVSRHSRPVPATGPAAVSRALQALAASAMPAGAIPVRLAVVSAADPVDRVTGRLIQLPDAPFLVGELAPAEALNALVAGPVTVDNDVHWAARAERIAAGPGALDDFAYLYLGEGLGCAVVSDGEVRRGHRGIAGEIAHLLTRGPRGRATAFIDVFAELRLRREASTAIDSAALVRSVDAATAVGQRTRAALAGAICGVLAGIVTLTDPELVIIGGPWGSHPAVFDAVQAEFAGQPRQVRLQAARVRTEAPLSGARQEALRALQAAILAAPDAAPDAASGAGQDAAPVAGQDATPEVPRRG